MDSIELIVRRRDVDGLKEVHCTVSKRKRASDRGVGERSVQADKRKARHTSVTAAEPISTRTH